MGACFSSGSSRRTLIETATGDEAAFHNRFLEDKVLGEGEFGVVKMVHDMTTNHEPLACKTLRKGVVFKDNTLYAPIKPQVLQEEVDILQTLQGESYCLKLIGVWETPKVIHVVTELCSGGEMMEWVSQQHDLHTEHVSRIADQLLQAVHHCDKHQVIHRDIKPENCMFRDVTLESELRLIDFGSGTHQPPSNKDATDSTDSSNEFHTTFAGSAFYISPEMFQRTYTSKTDVWSAGVTLYVLVAGYPADQLQKTFNVLQKAKRGDLRKALPNLQHMPDSYIQLLEELLVYRHKKRKSAGELLNQEFLQFHKTQDQHDPSLTLQDIQAAARTPQEEADDQPTAMSAEFNKNTGSSSIRRSGSVRLSASVHRHATFLGFKKFERSLTTLLATLLNKTDLQALMKRIEQHITTQRELEIKDTNETAAIEIQEQRLQVILIRDLKPLLQDHPDVLSNINDLPNAATYNDFAYHVELLEDFVQREEQANQSSSRRRSTFTRNLSFAEHSNHSTGGIFRRSSGKGGPLNNSVHGATKMFQIRKAVPRNKMDGSDHSNRSWGPRRASTSAIAGL